MTTGPWIDIIVYFHLALLYPARHIICLTALIAIMIIVMITDIVIITNIIMNNTGITIMENTMTGEIFKDLEVHDSILVKK